MAIIDKLMPPQSMVTAIANARMPSTGICEATDWKLLIDQKISGIVMLKAATVSTNRPIK
ncbi:hypothetical protein ECZC01_00780 [Escherichia coli]|nr:hypothetical protein ECZU24_17760 [Escherichia coli]GHL24441.1 hypothetical protein ECZU25_12540 [Escherichia coli]GHL75874.1 hypothetical protein ECZU34_36220 [Escherichia coli]GJH43872.1 hypothetical protein ECZC01_00780 [Escherichia coli]